LDGIRLSDQSGRMNRKERIKRCLMNVRPGGSFALQKSNSLGLNRKVVIHLLSVILPQ
jgi:hypothetical protein